MFMTDKDVVVDGFGIFQVVTEEVRIYGDVDISKENVEGTTTPPPEMHVVHIDLSLYK
jgi:hypothetical protein